jgi:hypothetical protein
MDDPFTSQLRQLTPAVDAVSAKSVLNRRLRKSRIRRRTTIASFSIAGLAMATFAVTQVADRSSNEVLVVGAPDPDPDNTVVPSDGGTQIGAAEHRQLDVDAVNRSTSLLALRAADQPMALAAFYDVASFTKFWNDLATPPTNAPGVDFETSVVLAIPADRLCPYFFDHFDLSGDRVLTPVSAENRPTISCAAKGKSYGVWVVAVDRATVVPNFTVESPSDSDSLFVDFASSAAGNQGAVPTSTTDADQPNSGLPLEADIEFQILGSGRTVGSTALAFANDPASYQEMWLLHKGLPTPPPTVDFEETIVVSITISDGPCPPELTSFESSPDRTLTPVFTESGIGCAEPVVLTSYIVAFERATVMPYFTLQLPSDRGPNIEPLVVSVTG